MDGPRVHHRVRRTEVSGQNTSMFFLVWLALPYNMAAGFVEWVSQKQEGLLRFKRRGNSSTSWWGAAKTLEENVWPEILPWPFGEKYKLPHLGLSWWLNSKESSCQYSKLGCEPWVGKIPWREGNGNPLHDKYLESPLDKGVHGLQRVRHDLVAKEQQQGKNKS